MLTQNPYEAVVVDAPEVSTWAVPFAVSATVAFELSAIASTGNDLSVYVGSPTAVLQNVVPAFVFALLIGCSTGFPALPAGPGLHCVAVYLADTYSARLRYQ